jgi:hypothetical protein
MSRLVIYAATLRIPEKKSCLCIAFFFPPLETLSLSLSLSLLGQLVTPPPVLSFFRKNKNGVKEIAPLHIRRNSNCHNRILFVLISTPQLAVETRARNAAGIGSPKSLAFDET